MNKIGIIIQFKEKKNDYRIKIIHIYQRILWKQKIGIKFPKQEVIQDII